MTYHDLVSQSKALRTTAQVANDFSLTTKKLNKILRKERVQYKGKSGAQLLYLKYLNNRYAEPVIKTYKDNEGNLRTKIRSRWTQKGRLFIYELLKGRGILPICEQEDLK